MDQLCIMSGTVRRRVGQREVLQRHPANIRPGTRDQVGAVCLNLRNLARHGSAVAWRTVHHNPTNLETIGRLWRGAFGLDQGAGRRAVRHCLAFLTGLQPLQSRKSNPGSITVSFTDRPQYRTPCASWIPGKSPDFGQFLGHNLNLFVSHHAPSMTCTSRLDYSRRHRRA